MHDQKYVNIIKDKVQSWPYDVPITTNAVATALTDTFNIDIENAKKVTNVNLKRIADKGELAHIQKGVYVKVKETPFGKTTPGIDEITAGLLLRDGENIIGYIAGPTLLNAIGLCSLIPNEFHIATNSYRQRLPAGTAIRIHRPLDAVNLRNAPYLQIIDAFMSMNQYLIDVDNPDEILRREMAVNKIDNRRLIKYARKHCDYKTLVKTIDVALGGNEDETP